MNKPLPLNAKLIPSGAKKVFSGEIFEIYQWQQQMFDGTFATFEMAKRPDTVAIAPIIDDKIILTKQLQPDWKEERLSLAGGRVDKNEDILTAAKRELLEETGLQFKNWKLIYIEQPEDKIEWFFYLFTATELTKQQPSKPDNGEKVEVVRLSWDDVAQYALTSKRLKVLTKYNSLQELTEATDLNNI